MQRTVPHPPQHNVLQGNRRSAVARRVMQRPAQRRAPRAVLRRAKNHCSVLAALGLALCLCGRGRGNLDVRDLDTCRVLNQRAASDPLLARAYEAAAGERGCPAQERPMPERRGLAAVASVLVGAKISPSARSCNLTHAYFWCCLLPRADLQPDGAAWRRQQRSLVRAQACIWTVRAEGAMQARAAGGPGAYARRAFAAADPLTGRRYVAALVEEGSAVGLGASALVAPPGCPAILVFCLQVRQMALGSKV